MVAKLLAVLSALLRRLGGGGPLCDRCKYDYGSVCTRPERPNAYRCPDFKER
jgi:hypothetical protein